MITITHGKFTYECRTLEEVWQMINKEQIVFDKATISFRVTGLPLLAFAKTQASIQDSGGKVV